MSYETEWLCLLAILAVAVTVVTVRNVCRRVATAPAAAPERTYKLDVVVDGVVNPPPPEKQVKP